MSASIVSLNDVMKHAYIIRMLWRPYPNAICISYSNIQRNRCFQCVLQSTWLCPLMRGGTSHNWGGHKHTNFPALGAGYSFLLYAPPILRCLHRLCVQDHRRSIYRASDNAYGSAATICSHVEVAIEKPADLRCRHFPPSGKHISPRWRTIVISNLIRICITTWEGTEGGGREEGRKGG